MKQCDKIAKIQKENHVKWSITYNRVFDELSGNQRLFCCCGKLATGLHESRCGKFLARVQKETLKRLEESG